MVHCNILSNLLRLAINKWRFRHEPKLVKLYTCVRVKYMPTIDVMAYAEIDVNDSQLVDAIKVRLRAYDVWFEVKEKSGRMHLFNSQLSHEDTEQAYRLGVHTEIDRMLRGLSHYRAETLHDADWGRLVRKVANAYHLDVT